MSILSFFLFFCMYLVIASLIISGFYIITRGEKTIQPDGKVRLTGKIFKQWSIFWERTTGTSRVYYAGHELKEKYRWLCQCNSEMASRLKLYAPAVNADPTSLEILGDLSSHDQNYIRDVLQCEILIDSSPHIFLYLDEPEYYFPEWLRYPLSQCPPCMASVGGTLLYWPVMILSDNVLAWTHYTTTAYIFFWLIFCLALSALNKLMYTVIGA